MPTKITVTVRDEVANLKFETIREHGEAYAKSNGGHIIIIANDGNKKDITHFLNGKEIARKSVPAIL